VNFRLRFAACDVNRAIRVDIHIHFAAHTEFGQVDSWLDAEARSPDDVPVLAGFQPVDVCAVTMNFLTDVVTGAVRELRTITRLLDYRSRGVIHFPAE
jgi:hypothetical protein